MILLGKIMIAAAESGILIPEPLLNIYLNEQNHRTLFLAELSSQKAYLLSFSRETLSLQIIREFSISSGKQKGGKRSEWDLRTPEGVYEITQFRPESSLEEKFGTGAFILNYPNDLDKILRKTGGGIWIHGTDRSDFIDFDSEGCIRLKNEDLTFLKDHLFPGQTPVFIVDKIIRKTAEDIFQENEKIKEMVNNWISTRQNRDLSGFLSFYHPTFYSTSEKMDIGDWSLFHKDRFEQNLPHSITMKELSFIYQDNYVLISCVEEIKRGTDPDRIKKNILWKRIDDHWFIVAENIEN